MENELIGKIETSEFKIKARCWRHSDTSFKEIPLENLRNKIEKTNNRADGGASI